MKYVLPLKIDFEKSHGSFLFDKQSQSEYLDFFSMYSSLPLGYNHPIFDHSFKEEIAKISSLKMANNICQSDEFFTFFHQFQTIAPHPLIHFTSTGALAVESAIKTAMEYKKISSPIVLSMEKSFHGVNSWGVATSHYGITGKRMEFFPQNNWPKLSIDELITYLKTSSLSNVAAVLIEPIQCTNGDLYVDLAKLYEIRELCTQHDICLIFDEIQTGFGTTGTMWYHEAIDVLPDIIVFGKKTQVSGIIVHQKYRAIFDSPYQKLDVTFDGDLVDMVRSYYILRAYSEYDILNNVQHQSKILREALSGQTQGYRSSGHLIAFDFENSAIRDLFVQRCFENHLIINKAGDVTVRLRPNLALNTEESAQAITIIKGILETL